MLKLSKFADYGTVILAYLASETDKWDSARGIAAATHVSLPMVSKILKLLVQQGFLTSRRGAQGGYGLARSADDITLAEILHTMDGGVAMTECSTNHSHCAVQPYCAVSQHWQTISHVIYDALSQVSLASITKPVAESGIYQLQPGAKLPKNPFRTQQIKLQPDQTDTQA